MMPRMRRKKQVDEIDRADVDMQILAGPVNPAEDLDPDLAVNPIQAHIIEQGRRAERKKKEALKAKRAAMLAQKIKGGPAAAGERPGGAGGGGGPRPPRV